MKLILDTENSHPTTITVRGKEITLLLIESSILIDSSQVAKIFDKKEKTVATKVQKAKLEKYETENVKLLKNYGLMNPEAIKPRPFYDLRQMLEGPAQYYFKQIDDLDLIEANEAFAAQSVAVGKDLNFDLDKLNVNGGAIALGHPVGASGARILVTLIYDMIHNPEYKKGLATLCIGGGMGCATIVEKYEG